MADETATTSNYFQIAVSDDVSAIIGEENEIQEQAVSSASAPEAVLDKAEIRKQRIEAAVQRSKSEYKSEHAYTERDWFTNNEVERNVLSKPKVDKQHLEYITTSLYYSTPPKYQEALNLIIQSFDPRAKHSGGLSRELLDTGLRCCLACNDVEGGVKLADSSKSLWKGQFAGIAASSSDAYLLARRYKDALTPLFTSTTSFGLHQPILSRLSSLLNLIISKDPPSSSSAEKDYSATKYFLGILDKVIIWKSNYLQKPLFDDPDSSHSNYDLNSTDTQGNIDTNSSSNFDISFDQPINLNAIIQELQLNSSGNEDEDLIQGLKGTINRLNKGFKNGNDNESEVVEKSVREL